MIAIRPGEARGVSNHGWLDSRHTFSFADYFDPDHMGFRNLRVLNEDRVEAGKGFGRHPHRDMEIVSYVLSGALGHQDSMGNGSTIRPGDVQRMTAGTGVFHSEMNASRTDPVHFLQIWILPARRGLAPGYEQKAFADDEKRGKLRLVASPEGRDGSITLHADARLYATLLERGERVEHEIPEGRSAWIQVVRGAIDVNGHALREGDGAAIAEERAVTISAREGAEVLVFDLV